MHEVDAALGDGTTDDRFEPVEIEMIALIARYHRQTTPRKSHEGFGELSGSLRQTVRRLGALVRLAEGLDRSHAQAIASVRVRGSGTRRSPWTIRLTTAGDAELELWAAHRHVAALSELKGAFATGQAAANNRNLRVVEGHDRHSL